MKTRTGKIARLPKPIRDELNHRLENGAAAPELLARLQSAHSRDKRIRLWETKKQNAFK
jgi:hypothetical protein